MGEVTSAAAARFRYDRSTEIRADGAGPRARLRLHRRRRAGRDRRRRQAFPRLPRRRRAWRHGLARGRIPNAASIRACCGPACVRSSCSASITAPMKIRSQILQQRTRGAISVYAQGDDYHDVIKKRLKTLARWLVGDVRRRRESVRRYRGGDGKAAGAGGGARLAGQAHQPGLARIRLLAVSRRDLHHARAAARRRRRRSLRLLPRLPGRSARPRHFPRPTSSMRGAAFRI